MGGGVVGWGGWAPFLPLLFNYNPAFLDMVGPFPATTAKRTLSSKDFKACLNVPVPHSNRGSKDSGHSDCQLEAPTRPIMSQRNREVSKRGTKEKVLFYEGY